MTDSEYVTATFASKRRVIVSRKAAGDAGRTDDDMTRAVVRFMWWAFAVLVVAIATVKP